MSCCDQAFANVECPCEPKTYTAGTVAAARYQGQIEALADLVLQNVLHLTDDTLMANNIENEWSELDYDEELLNDLRIYMWRTKN